MPPSVRAPPLMSHAPYSFLLGNRHFNPSRAAGAADPVQLQRAVTRSPRPTRLEPLSAHVALRRVIRWIFLPAPRDDLAQRRRVEIQLLAPRPCASHSVDHLAYLVGAL